MRDKVVIVLKRLSLLTCFIMIWKITSNHVNNLFIPDPYIVWKDFLIVLRDGSLLKALIYSFKRIMIASLLSSVVAIPIGIAVYNSTIANDIFSPTINIMRYLPVTAFYPLLIMWFGIEDKMKIAFLFIATFVYMMPSVVLCLEEINSDLIDTGLTIGMSKMQTILRIQIPSTLPSIMNSFIMMFGIGWTYIAVAETVNAKYGLGWIIQQSSSRGRTDMVFMAIMVIMVISVVFDTVAKFTVRKIFKWRYLNED